MHDRFVSLRDSDIETYASRWETDTRYFAMSSSRDLLGDLVIVRHWGGKHSRRHGRKMSLFFSTQDALSFVRTIERRRVRNGYRRTA